MEQEKTLNNSMIEGLLRMTFANMLVNPELRFGQSFFNNLNHVRPDLAGKLRGAKYDPFHSNDVVGAINYLNRPELTKVVDITTKENND